MRENIMRRLLDARAYLSATKPGYACPHPTGQSTVRLRGLMRPSAAVVLLGLRWCRLIEAGSPLGWHGRR